MFEKGNRERVDADTACQITHSVTADPVGHNKQMPETAPFGVICAEPCGERILVDGAAHSHVSARRILHNGGSWHRCYSGETADEFESLEGAFREAAEDGDRKKAYRGVGVPDREVRKYTQETSVLTSEQSGNRRDGMLCHAERGPAGLVKRLPVTFARHRGARVHSVRTHLHPARFHQP